jgi:hypothetical protein
VSTSTAHRAKTWLGTPPEIDVNSADGPNAAPLSEAVQNFNKDLKTQSPEQRDRALSGLNDKLTEKKDEIQKNLDDIHDGKVPNELSTKYPNVSERAALEAQNGSLDRAIENVDDMLADVHRQIDNASVGMPSVGENMIPAPVDIAWKESPKGPEPFRVTIVVTGN